jgi:hypothetical protein
MSAKRIALPLLCLGALLIPASGASGATTPGPAWQLLSYAMPTHFVPGQENELFLVATNLGGKRTEGPIAFKDILPEGLKALKVNAKATTDLDFPGAECKIEADKRTVICTSAGPLGPSRQLEVAIGAEVKAATTGILEDDASISGGGATEVKAATPIPIDPTPPPFGFLPGSLGFSAPLTEADGSPSTLAGSHPYQLTTSLGFPTEKVAGGVIEAAGHLKDAFGDLPPGLIINPAASPVLCTEAQLVSSEGCPDASAVGTVTITTFVASGLETTTSPLFNMVPPPGQAANLGFDAVGIGVFVHLDGEVRSEEDFGLTGSVYDALALPLHPVFGSRLELWGDPSDPTHDKARGSCAFGQELNQTTKEAQTCPVPPQTTAFLTLPSYCPGEADLFGARASSWEDPGTYEEAFYEGASLSGTPTPIAGCGQLDFEPTVQAKPTTTLTDSPSGLDVRVHQPQETSLAAERSTAILKDFALTLPDGLVINPAAAKGQAACSPAQIGMKTAVGDLPPHFFKTPATCPDAAKLGTLKAKTPLLAQVDETKTKVQRDAEGNPIPRTLEGSLYLAEPFQNPFGSLLAVYLVIEDPLTSTVVKLASEVEADPTTGQITTYLEESPQLPVEDFEAHLFEGDRASLRTPAACSEYQSQAELLPWSFPEGPLVEETDSFALTSSPGGGPCPTSPQAAPNKPGFVAGTVSPQAGAYSPFVLKISRNDGSQPLGGFEATLPRGMSAKFAGIPYCTEPQIAQAASRSHPNQGRIELNNPSCPPASEVGEVDVAAGAGPNPFHTGGKVYLAGPYKGAPLSTVVITPAVAGPFDLGAVVVRAALYVNPETAQGRIVSDPLPTILEGIPLDLREATVKAGRPQFALNPTSCEPKSALATTTSIFGQPAALSYPFQVGGCSALGFKPKFAFRLKGKTKRTGHPKLIVTGSIGGTNQANLERASIAFPRSEFLDQAHIGTVCTRVQFAAHQCPPRSVYGFAKATTPLFDKPLEGPVYLRSSNNELPDLVFALAGQVEVALVSRIDSVNGGIRATAEGVPDAPVSSFRIEMQGGKKGLLINSTNLCKKPNYATVKLRGQNGKTKEFKALLRNDCPKKGKGKPKQRH